MCYLIHEPQAGAAQSSGAAPGQNGLRPRWIGAIGAALIGGLALAAIVDPQAASPLLKAAAPAPLAQTSPALPTPSADRAQTDDGVAASEPDGVKAGLGRCSHDL